MPIEYINRDTLYKKFGEGLTQFYKDCDKLPRIPCISCERLIIRDPYYLKEIKTSWKHIHNKAYKNLLSYLNSHERVSIRKEPKYNSLVGLSICKSCSDDFNKDKVPSRSIMNGLDVGPVPDCISCLTLFESIFIRLAICYQTIIKLTTRGGKVPYNLRMGALRGFSVSIPTPISETIKEMTKDSRSRLINPDDYIVIYGIPQKKTKKFGKVSWMLTKFKELYCG